MCTRMSRPGLQAEFRRWPLCSWPLKQAAPVEQVARCITKYIRLNRENVIHSLVTTLSHRGWRGLPPAPNSLDRAYESFFILLAMTQPLGS